jgi:hypothetical protein
MVSIIQFVVFVVLVLILAGLGMVYTSQFLEYLKKHHPSKYEEIMLKSFLGIPSEYFAYLANPVNLLWFLFSAESLDDDKVVFYKRRLKLSLFLTIGFFIAWFVFIPV